MQNHFSPPADGFAHFFPEIIKYFDDCREEPLAAPAPLLGSSVEFEKAMRPVLGAPPGADLVAWLSIQKKMPILRLGVGDLEPLAKVVGVPAPILSAILGDLAVSLRLSLQRLSANVHEAGSSAVLDAIGTGSWLGLAAMTFGARTIDYIQSAQASFCSASCYVNHSYHYIDNLLDRRDMGADRLSEFLGYLRARVREGPLPPTCPLTRYCHAITTLLERDVPREGNEGVYAAVADMGEREIWCSMGARRQDTSVAELMYATYLKGGGTAYTWAVCQTGGSALDDATARLCVAIGFAVQLADDLLDRERDMREGNRTVFTEPDIDSPTWGLMRFAQKLSDIRSSYWDGVRDRPRAASAATAVRFGLHLMLRRALMGAFNAFGRPLQEEVLYEINTDRDIMNELRSQWGSLPADFHPLRRAANWLRVQAGLVPQKLTAHAH